MGSEAIRRHTSAAARSLLTGSTIFLAGAAPRYHTGADIQVAGGFLSRPAARTCQR